MKKILLVDDDEMIREIYRRRFVRAGYEVETAADGLQAAKSLRIAKPDLVVLDLMMPRLSGVDLLKFIRGDAGLAATPVIILTNSFLGELADAANGLGIQKAMTKAQTTPDELMGVVHDILEPAATPAPTPAVVNDAPHSPAMIRRQFLENAPATVVALRALHQEYEQSTLPEARVLKRDAFYRKMHFVSTMAGMAECHDIALLSGVFEALLFELESRPTHDDASTSLAMAQGMEFLEFLFANAHTRGALTPLAAQVLVVDDDPLANHLTLAALNRMHLKARSADNPLTGLEMLRQMQYDLVLLDVEMPHMNGFDLCRKLRTLPGYATTPVVYVTTHDDFNSRTAGALAGGNDYIAKPIFPFTLALKVVTHLIRQRLI